MRTRAGIVLQARYASTRLRGKALEPVGGRAMIEQCLRRLIRAGVARVVLATTDRPEDDVLEALASRLGVAVYRGAVDDVLGRISQAARTYDLDPVLRATGDNPAVDVQAPGRVLAALRATQADYIREDGVPWGSSVEGMTADALHRAAELATAPYDREHVTTFIRSRRDLFRVTRIPAPAPLTRPELRLTIDTAEDLAWVRELFFRAGSDDPSLAALIAASGSRRPLRADSHGTPCRAEVA
jgi:spore coat polysaccharide biosynthesis protein SpsF (cytidylyltransferase family)